MRSRQGFHLALAGLTLAAALSAWPVVGVAQDVTLRIHHFLPAPAPVPKNFITPWAEKVAKEAGGKLKVDFGAELGLGLALGIDLSFEIDFGGILEGAVDAITDPFGTAGDILDKAGDAITAPFEAIGDLFDGDDPAAAAGAAADALGLPDPGQAAAEAGAAIGVDPGQAVAEAGAAIGVIPDRSPRRPSPRPAWTRGRP